MLKNKVSKTPGGPGPMYASRPTTSGWIETLEPKYGKHSSVSPPVLVCGPASVTATRTPGRPREGPHPRVSTCRVWTKPQAREVSYNRPPTTPGVRTTTDPATGPVDPRGVPSKVSGPYPCSPIPTHRPPGKYTRSRMEGTSYILGEANSHRTESLNQDWLLYTVSTVR